MANEVAKPDYSYQWSSGGSIVAPSDVKIQTGWTAEVPPYQWENWSQNRQDNAILHLFQKGISEWDAASNYYFTTSGVRSYVQGSDGNIYVAVQDSVGQNPTTDSTDTYWKIAFITDTSLVTFSAASGPVIGSVRNGVMSIATASASATYTADEVVLKTALVGTVKTIGSFSKTINLATTGAGGMDTGTAPVSGYVAIYAIYNPTTGVSALLAKNATAGVQTEVYSGANMPAGYTESTLVSVWATDGSSLLKIGYQRDRCISIFDTQVLSTTTAHGTLTSLSVAAAVPFNATKAKFRVNLAGSTAGVVLTSSIASSSTQIGISTMSVSGQNAGAGFNAEMGLIAMITPQTVFYTNATSAGAIAGFEMKVTEYWF